jgi:hypothetical protein
LHYEELTVYIFNDKIRILVYIHALWM